MSNRRRKASGRGSLAEDALSGEQLNAEIIADARNRVLYERWHTELLLAWLIDWKVKVIKANYTNREWIIDQLIAGKHPLPKRNHELREFVAAWRRVFKKSKAPAPGPYHNVADNAAIAAEEGLDALSASESEEDSASEPEEKSAPIAKKAKKAHIVSTAPPSTAAAAASSASSSGASPQIPKRAQCLTCTEYAPYGNTATWKCDCGLRGDLAFEHAINVALWALIVAKMSARPCRKAS